LLLLLLVYSCYEYSCYSYSYSYCAHTHSCYVLLRTATALLLVYLLSTHDVGVPGSAQSRSAWYYYSRRACYHLLLLLLLLPLLLLLLLRAWLGPEKAGRDPKPEPNPAP